MMASILTIQHTAFQVDILTNPSGDLTVMVLSHQALMKIGVLKERRQLRSLIALGKRLSVQQERLGDSFSKDCVPRCKILHSAPCNPIIYIVTLVFKSEAASDFKSIPVLTAQPRRYFCYNHHFNRISIRMSVTKLFQSLTLPGKPPGFGTGSKRFSLRALRTILS